MESRQVGQERDELLALAPLKRVPEFIKPLVDLFEQLSGLAVAGSLLCQLVVV